MPISKAKYDLLLDACISHGINFDTGSVPLPEHSRSGSEAAFEEAFLDELIESNPDSGFLLESTHGYEDPDKELYLKLLRILLDISGVKSSRADLKNEIDEEGKEIVTLQLDGNKASWIGDIQEEYIDTDILQSMISMVNKYSDKELYLSGLDGEDYFIFAFPAGMTRLLRDIFVDKEEIPVEKPTGSSRRKEISLKDFYGERRGAELSEAGEQAGNDAIAMIKDNDLSSFKAKLDEIGAYVFGSLVVDQITNALLYPESFHEVDKLPNRPELEPYFEALGDKFLFHFITDIRLPLSLEEFVYPATKNPQASRYINILLEKRGGESIKTSLRRAIYNAAQFGLNELLERFLEIEKKSIDSDEYDQSIDSATHAAIRGTHLETVKYLSDFWDESYLETESKWLLQSAVEQGDLALIQFLVDKGCLPEANDKNLFKNAIATGNLEIIAYLFNRGLKLPADGRLLTDALQKLATSAGLEKRGNTKAITEFLVSQDNEFWSRAEELDRAVEVAVERGRAAWEARYSEDKNDQEWGRAHLWFVHELVARYIVECEAKGDEGKQDMLELMFKACHGTMPLVVEKLLNLGLDLESQDDHGRTPVQIADHEAGIYILGSRRRLSDIYKLCSINILMQLDADLSRFPEEWVEKGRKFVFEF